MAQCIIGVIHEGLPIQRKHGNTLAFKCTILTFNKWFKTHHNVAASTLKCLINVSVTNHDSFCEQMEVKAALYRLKISTMAA